MKYLKYTSSNYNYRKNYRKKEELAEEGGAEKCST